MDLACLHRLHHLQAQNGNLKPPGEEVPPHAILEQRSHADEGTQAILIHPRPASGQNAMRI